MATKDDVDWLLHIDTDELMYPGGNAGFSLQNVLSTFADEVDTVVFPNYESLPETDKVHDPFTEVNLESSLCNIVLCLKCSSPEHNLAQLQRKETIIEHVPVGTAAPREPLLIGSPLLHQKLLVTQP